MKATESADFLSLGEIASAILAMRKIGVADRTLVVRLLMRALERYPQYLGLWCVFEPNAFDGRDAEFIGRKGHDPCGRFTPRWERKAGTLRFGRSYGHDSPSLGAWYFLARDSRQEVVFGPYDEQMLTGLPYLCLSRVVPMLERDRFIGAVGVDIALDALLTAATREKPAGEIPLEATLGRWHVFLHSNGEIEFASRTARRLLSRHLGPCRHDRLPVALAKRLKDGDARGPFCFRSPRGMLQVNGFVHPHTGQRILSLEEVVEVRRLTLGGGSISVREQEVLEWVEQGKSNAEIALILGISEHTVRHHLERIFAKLGVENRRAAMLCIQQVRRSAIPRFISHTPPWNGPV